jgi:SulP family sulfate permease
MIFFSGLILVAIALMGVSRLIYFTPYSVVAGFMCGIGVIVMVLEFDSFMGHEPVHSVMEGLKNIPHTLMHPSAEALMISIPTLAILFLWPRLVRNAGKLKMVPAPLVGLIVGTAIANLGSMNVHYIGDIPTGLPNLYWPDWSRFGELFVPAAGLAGLAVFDSLLTCIVADHMMGTKHSSDRESFGQGLANMGAGLCGGLTTATATMRTVANIQSGGKTPLASFVHGLVLLALVLGLGPYAEQIPMACLAAILFKVGIDILDYRIMPVLHRLPASDMIVFWTVFVITIVEDLLVAMGVGLVLAFFRFAQEMSRVYKAQMISLNHYANGEEDLEKNFGERVKVLKPHGPLFFGSVQQLERTFEKADEYDVLLVKLKDVTMMDLSGAYALENLAEKARDNGKAVVFCNAPEHVKRVLERVKVLDHSGDIHYCEAIDDAIRKIETLFMKPSSQAA